MQWFTEHCSDHWTFSSADDDVLPDLPTMYHQIDGFKAEEKTTHSGQHVPAPIICHFRLMENEVPILTSIWKNQVSESLYPLYAYPDFCSGGFYSMSSLVCRAIFRISRHHKYFYNDDVWFTGILRLAAIHAGLLPCHDIADQHCALATIEKTTAHHFE